MFVLVLVLPHVGAGFLCVFLLRWSLRQGNQYRVDHHHYCEEKEEPKDKLKDEPAQNEGLTSLFKVGIPERSWKSTMD